MGRPVQDGEQDRDRREFGGGGGERVGGEDGEVGPAADRDPARKLALTLYALLVSNFLDTVSNVLQLAVVLLVPGIAVHAVDILLRHNRYDGRALRSR